MSVSFSNPLLGSLLHRALRLGLAVSLTSAIAACAANSHGDDGQHCSGGKCDGDGSGSGGMCSDPRYGDGTCQTSLNCDIPDIDCFHTFSDDAAAAMWSRDGEAALAQAQS